MNQNPSLPEKIKKIPQVPLFLGGVFAFCLIIFGILFFSSPDHSPNKLFKGKRPVKASNSKEKQTTISKKPLPPRGSEAAETKNQKIYPLASPFEVARKMEEGVALSLSLSSFEKGPPEVNSKGPSFRWKNFQDRIETLIIQGDFSGARALVQYLMGLSSEGEKSRLKKLLRNIREEEKRDLQYWSRRRALIEKHLLARELWLETEVEIDNLKKYLRHKSWVFRALGVVALAELQDRRAWGELAVALKDKNTLVQAMALKVLSMTYPEELRKTKGIQDLFEAMIYQLGRTRQFRLKYLTLLRGLSGRKYSQKDQWKVWWEENKKLFNPRVIPPYNLKQFSSAELKKYNKDLNIESRIRRKTVLKSVALQQNLDALQKDGLEVVICLDVTGSMGKVLEQARQNVGRIMLLLKEAVGNFRIGLVTYRDEVCRVRRLTENWLLFRNDLFRETAKGGGDNPEGVEKALTVALGMKWKKKAYSMVIIIGDAPPHREDLGTFFRMAQIAKRKGIFIHAIYPKTFQVREIEDAVKITGGMSHTLKHEGEFSKNFLLLAFGRKLEKYISTFLRLYWQVQREVDQK